jgi:hypothetical protein
VTLAACVLSVAPVACLSDMPLSSIRPRRSAYVTKDFRLRFWRDFTSMHT